MKHRPTQHTKIIQMLKRRSKSGVPNYAFPEVGILCYSKRIQELRKDGWNITVDRWFDNNGKGTNTFIYKLIED